MCLLVWLSKLVIAFVMRFFHTRSQLSFAHTGLFFWLHKHAWEEKLWWTLQTWPKRLMWIFTCANVWKRSKKLLWRIEACPNKNNQHKEMHFFNKLGCLIKMHMRPMPYSSNRDFWNCSWILSTFFYVNFVH